MNEVAIIGVGLHPFAWFDGKSATKAGVTPGDVDVIQLQDSDDGLIANGGPIGALGLRQIHELVRQLRGDAGRRQIPGQPRAGFAQLHGAPGNHCDHLINDREGLLRR